MKRIPPLLILALTLAAATQLPAAEVPDGFNYQGRLVAASGDDLLDGNYNITFRLYTGLSGGEAVWGPQTSQVPLVKGLFNAVLGPMDSSNRDILDAFHGSDRYLELQIEQNNPITPRQRILSVPYAIRAQSASQADLATEANNAATVAGQNLSTVVFGGDQTYQQFDITKIPDAITRDDEVPGLLRAALARPIDVGVGADPHSSGIHRLHVVQPGTADGSSAVYGNAPAASGSTMGLFGHSASTSGRGVYGHATSTTGLTYGLSGRAESTTGRGVFGNAVAKTGLATGVYGRTDSESGRGVVGEAVSTAGTTIGVYGRAYSPTGEAVVGYNSATTGLAPAVRGTTDSAEGRAVRAHATSKTGVTYGVLSTAESEKGAALYGHATSPTGATFGVYALGDSDAARAVHGHARSTTGTTYGLWGRVSSPMGYAGYFTGGRNYFQGNVGIGTINPQAPLDIAGNARITGDIFDPNARSGADGIRPYGETVKLRTTGRGRLVTIAVSEEMILPPTIPARLRIMVDGEAWFSANKGKTFVIEHPTHDTSYLVHATLEGPENAVFYRGEACLEHGLAIIELPHYFEALTHEDGRTVQLTAVDGFDRLAVQSQDGQAVSGGQFSVISDNPHSTQRFMWEVKAVRKDIEPLEVEVSKEDAVLMGDGPYTYLMQKVNESASTPLR